MVTVVVPTLAADDALGECLKALLYQTFGKFEVIVVDNSGCGRAKVSGDRVRVIENRTNVGFGAAINQAIRETDSPFIAALNDDATVSAKWLEALVKAAEKNPKAGMFASQVRLADTGLLDSAGMEIALDGSSKQRGHNEDPSIFAKSSETLFPTGSAALYRRKMLDEIGLFDERYFLYCEDTDLGLRARWAGWECIYVPEAVVEHAYSKSAGRASPLKAYYVERNRLYTVVKNFPFSMLAMVKFFAFARYFWHLVFMLNSTGKAAEFHQAGHSPWLLPFMVLRAHVATLARLPYLWKERRRIFAKRKLTSNEFRALLHKHSMPIRKVAEL